MNIFELTPEEWAQLPNVADIQALISGNAGRADLIVGIPYDESGYFWQVCARDKQSASNVGFWELTSDPTTALSPARHAELTSLLDPETAALAAAVTTDVAAETDEEAHWTDWCALF